MSSTRSPDSPSNRDLRSCVTACREWLSPHAPERGPSTRRRIYELDALRAMAAINLVLFHFTHVHVVRFGFSEPLGGEWPYGAYGVMLFFILSGFVNSMSLLRRGRPQDFLVARLIRILPLFLLAILVNLIIYRLAPLNGHVVSWQQLAANLTLMPRVFGYECLDPVMWTLQVEMMFYVLLIALYRTGGLSNHWIGWGSLLTASFIMCPWLDTAKITCGDTTWFAVLNGVRHLLVLDFAPLFAIGFLLYKIKTENQHRAFNLIGIVFAATIFHHIDHGKHNPVATLFIVGLVWLAAYGKIPVLRVRPMVYISTISYALYLCHNNLGCVLLYAFDRAGVPPIACLLIAIAFSFSVAILVTQRIEQPITRWLRSHYDRLTTRTFITG